MYEHHLRNTVVPQIYRCQGQSDHEGIACLQRDCGRTLTDQVRKMSRCEYSRSDEQTAEIAAALFLEIVNENPPEDHFLKERGSNRRDRGLNEEHASSEYHPRTEVVENVPCGKKERWNQDHGVCEDILPRESPSVDHEQHQRHKYPRDRAAQVRVHIHHAAGQHDEARCQKRNYDQNDLKPDGMLFSKFVH